MIGDMRPMDFFLSFPFGGKCLPCPTPWGEFFVVKRYVEENS